ncbi:hypothetical protein A1O7_00284 [Cladophialophora yegresii CBS 114405]|uniref:Uncharacterized protein n=1 Tax=Cladophialophora yegresii CBS 114405 TaxID=1182544 RepID=W9X0D5_9EURO|nr:uncharacterized protein A1O7_00284 [Cladophialophora yegresii CBS 114405]EXJ63949.1 hypothetical protein A1O7_00284 [Cladophialophora yegresii CBS 114405]
MERSRADGRSQEAGRNTPASNASLVDHLGASAPASPRKLRPRPPKFLNAIDRRSKNGMINPAPVRVIRTEENDPKPSLPSVVAAFQKENDLKTKPPPKKKQKLDSNQEQGPQTLPPPPPQPSYKRAPKIPETPAEAQPWDKMLWQKGIDGKGWREIAEDWERLTDTRIERMGEAKDVDVLRKRRQLIDRLAVRLIRLKENYAASGTMELPDAYYKKHPEDLMYKYISDRKRQDIKLIRIMDMTKAQLEEMLWKTFCRNYKEEEGLDISVTEARESWEALVNGVLKPKPTATEERDMIKAKKAIRREPVAIKHEDED